MISTETRNRKIDLLIESAVSDFSKLFGTEYKVDEDIFYVMDNEGTPHFFLYAEYNENSFRIIVETLVYYDLPLSITIKLREVYRAENIVRFLSDNDMLLYFYEDKHLLTQYSFDWAYKNYALLKSKLLIEVFNQLRRASEIRSELNEILDKKSAVGAC
jgi:hypothetical protein